MTWATSVRTGLNLKARNALVNGVWHILCLHCEDPVVEENVPNFAILLVAITTDGNSIEVVFMNVTSDGITENGGHG